MLEGELADFVGVEGKVVALVHFGAVEMEGLRRQLARVAIPPIGEQNSAQIDKQRRNRHGETSSDEIENLRARMVSKLCRQDSV